MAKKNKVNIRPGVSILSVLKHIEYEPWYALAEFVDNAIDSYQRYQKELRKLHGKDYKLVVNIDINDNDQKITILDNAAGIHEKDYERAFRAAEIPPDRTGLSEFGMGMKTAACWFSDFWTVRTTALGEGVERTVNFDLNEIFDDKLEELTISTKKVPALSHYTEIEILHIDKMPVRRTKGKIKEHLTSIYRDFIRKGVLELKLNNEVLEYQEPDILNAPFLNNKTNKPILWRKEINITVEKNLRIYGFVALREKMSNSETGFALFRRGRVVEGSADEGFKPKEIMGDIGSPEYKRIFGELHLEGFKVNFTKKGVKWDETLSGFLEKLKKELSDKNFPFLRQAREFRLNPTTKEMKNAAKAAVNSTVDKLETEIKPALQNISEKAPLNDSDTALKKVENSYSRDFEIAFNNSNWLISVEISFDPGVKDWVQFGRNDERDKKTKKVVKSMWVRMSLNHPFVQSFAGTDKGKIEPLLRIAAALCLAEESAKNAGVKQAGTIRRNLNKLLDSLAK